MGIDLSLEKFIYSSLQYDDVLMLLNFTLLFNDFLQDTSDAR